MGLGVQPLNPQHLVTSHGEAVMDINSKEEFIYFMQRACEDQSNDCYIELYNILLRAFVCADCDFDGQVSEDAASCLQAANGLPAASYVYGTCCLQLCHPCYAIQQCFQ